MKKFAHIFVKTLHIFSIDNFVSIGTGSNVVINFEPVNTIIIIILIANCVIVSCCKLGIITAIDHRCCTYCQLGRYINTMFKYY